MFLPDGLLTSGLTKHDVGLDPHIIAPDPFASDDCFNDFSPVHQLLLKSTSEPNTMNQGADEPSSGLNGRLRPRKSNVSSPQTNKPLRRSEGKNQDKVKRTSTPSKTPSIKLDDLVIKSDTTFLCPYCDRKFASKQTLSKHVRRMHGSSSKQDNFIACLFCNHYEAETNDIVRHMVEFHTQQYFACLNCHTRFPSSPELAEHKSKTCELKLPYRSKLRKKVSSGSLKETQKSSNVDGKSDFTKESNVFTDGHGFNGIVISCELKPSQTSDGADIEDNITTNLILPPSKSLGCSTVVEKNAVIVLDDIQWNKRIPSNFSFHNTDADQILSRLGVVHRSPRTGESSKKDWKNVDDTAQKFEKCFDTSFYSKVASNVQENISKFLDGSFNFNPDPDSTIKTRKSKNSVIINTAEGFPILLASEQYSRNVFDRYMPRAIAPKHKWKWDNLESEKSPINPDQLKRDSHTNNCIITLVSSLDIWTQLRMRSKFEEKFGCPPLEKKTEKQTTISNELKDILESRELPTTSSQVVKVANKPRLSSAGGEFPACLGLRPATASSPPPPAVLSGEWVRPRCYVCCACGAQTRHSRAANTHAATQHPNAQVQHYEIVGEQLLNADIVKHLYVPPSQMSNRTRPLRGFRECTKCKKSITLEDLHQHMLDCAGDTPAVRRKCRYRPFGVRRRRPRLPDNTIRKKIRKDIRTRQTRPKSLLRPRPIRTEVGDAETIRKMIADLPAKRHRVLVNPTNPSLRPRIKQRPKLLIKGRSSEERNKRKKRSNKDSNVSQPRSMNEGTSSKSDEDKPLKPKIKRLNNKISRTSETDKRKATVLNRPKRKIHQLKEVQKNDGNNDKSNPTCSSKGVMTEEMSIENSSDKIDVQTADIKARERVGRGNSTNRDGQRPTCSGQNGNLQNHIVPVQNIPLKHSIARLTADSEKHDKSVQFHHLFLVQQECNNVNQHDQSGQQILFENEAAVLTLDKPPLHSNSKSPLDAYFLQKNKLNRPRKGLNACIAMLKNKLVDPVTSTVSVPTGHVSVQCGDDEPLYIKTDTTTQVPTSTQLDIQLAQSDKTQENNPNIRDISEAGSCIVDLKINNPSYTSVDIENNHQTSTPNTSAEITLKQVTLGTEPKREPCLRRSPVLDATVIEGSSQLELITPQNDTTELISLSRTVSPNNSPSSGNATKPLSINKQNIEISNIDEVKESVAIEGKTYVNPNVSTHLVPKSNPNKPFNLIIQEKEVIHGEHIVSHCTSAVITEPSKQTERNDYYDNTLNIQQPNDFHLDCEYNRKVLPENYPATDFNHMPVNIRPAHSSTNVESIVSIPLDLSGKVPNVSNSQDLSNHENIYALRNSYDSYETLDLSNKNQDLGHATDNNLTISNEIVDLSVKTSHSKVAEVLTRKDDVPTDLTVKKKGQNFSTALTAVTADKDDNLSNIYLRITDKQVKTGLDDVNPNYKSTTIFSIRESQANDGEEKNLNSDLTCKSKPTELSPKRCIIAPSVSEENVIDNVLTDVLKEPKTSDKIPEDIIKDLPSPISPVLEYAHKRTRDVKKVVTSSPAMYPIVCEKSSAQSQKPIYDPTLKIPQYKIRVSATVEAPANVELTTNTICSLVHATSPPTCALVPSDTVAAAIPSQDIFAMNSVRKPIGSQERAQNYGSVSAVASNSNAGNMFGMSKCGISPNSSKYESTTPVYTLANACISVTKIESTNSTTLTNTLLSIPGTTIANTTAVYTLAGTTIGVPTKYSHVIPTQPPCVQGVKDPADRFSLTEKLDEFDTTSSSSKCNDHNKERNIFKDFRNTANPLLNINHDPETARKIALLPKELVDILGNMPVDHRNQLLNVLPQYVSMPTAISGLQSDFTSISESSEKSTLSSIAEQKEVTATGMAESLKETELNLTTLVNQDKKKPITTLKSVTQFNYDKTSSMPSVPHHTALSSNIPHFNDNAKKEETLTLKIPTSQDQPQVENLQIKSDLSSEQPYATLTSTTLPLCDNICADKVIDLTEDEIQSRSETMNECPPEISPQLSVLAQPKRNKSNNDQTASLRAVRIKAPSERQKSIDNHILKSTIVTPTVTSKNINDQDNEATKSLHVNVSLNTDISLAIQQAEVSSTQHSNKNVIAECKFPFAISPNAQESIVDDINNCSSRRTSTASKDEIMKIDDVKNIPLKSVSKTILVTSSIINNTNNGSTGDKNRALSRTESKFSSNELIIPEGDEFNKVNPVSLQETSDISESYDLGLPVQSSTPKSKTGLDTQSESVQMSENCEEPEDSDDDVSLAVICKQKHQYLLKNDNVHVDHVTQNESITVRKRIKRNKKGSESLKSESGSVKGEVIYNNNVLLPIETDKNNLRMNRADTNETPLKCVDDVEQSITLVANVRKKARKSRGNKNTSDNISKVEEKIPSVTLTDCELNNDLLIMNTRKMNLDKRIKLLESEKRDEIKEIYEDSNYTKDTLQKCSKGHDASPKQHHEENENLSKHAEVVLRQKNKKKKRIPEEISSTSKEQHKVRGLDDVTAMVKSGDSGGAGTINSNSDITEMSLTAGSSSNIKEHYLNKISEKESNALLPIQEVVTATSITNVDDIPSALCPQTNETENMTTSLRRSRRGKSVCNSVEVEEPLQMETSLENKTPLTKKQLIFSKLLLDEENNVKLPEGASPFEKELPSLPGVAAAESSCVESRNMDKNKSVKRKKSPHLKRKCKRKKSLLATINCDEVNESSLQNKQIEETITIQITNLESGTTSDKSRHDKSTLKMIDIATSNDTENSLVTDENVPLSEKRKSGDLTCLEIPQPKKIKFNPTQESAVQTSDMTKSTKDLLNEHLETDVETEKEEPNVSRYTEKQTTSGIEESVEHLQTLSKITYNEQELEYSSISKRKGSKLNENDLRVNTCYNMPAGRRTRSKSAVIKSAAYDPYDIDMDDMIEQTEPRKARSHRRLSSNTKSVAKGRRSSPVCDENSEMKLNREVKPSPLKSHIKNDVSDSDDSSKSDIPLKKYVEEKERKCGETDESDIIHVKKDTETDVSPAEKNEFSNEKRDKITHGVCNSDQGVVHDETEEQLRSEQFMESFGFFSERKPRKSNLLATKKISETFHIIANECDDMYFGFKERSVKKSMQTENRKSTDGESNLKGTRQRSPLSKKSAKRGRKKKTSNVATPSYCHICKKEFRRPDNFLRHQMTLLHVSKLSEVEMKLKTIPVQEEPNYLLAYKEHLDRIKVITDKITKRKKNSKSAPKITPLTLDEILADVNKIVREQQLSQRGLSCDEELFLDCCELLKESHKKPEPVPEAPTLANDTNTIVCSSQSPNIGLDFLGKSDVDMKCENKNDGDVDSITAKSILESEEVRNLENDLISGLKEAANASNMKSNIPFQHNINEQEIDQQQEFSDHFSSPAALDSHYDHSDNYEDAEEADPSASKSKKYPEFKEKMYPDIEEIDMFEDKFDKIKRKCRSQAAAAKQTQLVVEPSTSRKGRKKLDKKKGKKSSKKSHPSTVLTKGALKGFDGIKVSIPTSDIDISAIVSPLGNSHKKKKKGNSKKRRENKNFESSGKYSSDHPANDGSASLKNVDVYEFMDNEDVELFEFRPSTLMERFKSISNKEIPSTSKIANPVVEEGDDSIASASDGDDFVYMSDDYVCSDDETENSLMSCDATSNTKNTSDGKKLLSHMKRKDAVEKNAVMGKIFKNNAVRTEKKVKCKEPEPIKQKANLDQLFDSLLEDEPSSSMLNDESSSFKDEVVFSRKYENSSTDQSDALSSKYDQCNIKNMDVDRPSVGKENYSSLKQKHMMPCENDDENSSLSTNYGPSTSKISMKSLIGDHKSTKHNKRHSASPQELKPVLSDKFDIPLTKQNVTLNKIEQSSTIKDDFLKYPTDISECDTEIKTSDTIGSVDKILPTTKTKDDMGISCDYNELCDQLVGSDETGVARQRARRKCTVGKQNILAETWSSESEPDGGPPRSNSAESIASGTARKKKGKKKDGHHTGGRRSNNRHISFRKQDYDSRVSSSSRHPTTYATGVNNSIVVDKRNAGSISGTNEGSIRAASEPGSASGPAMESLGTLSSSSGVSSLTLGAPSILPECPSREASSLSGAGTGDGAGEAAAPTFLVPAEPTEGASSAAAGSAGGKGQYHTVFYWSPAEGDGEPAQPPQPQQPLQPQQHGWIVGDSHKKLVTMLAHAKGRKRNNEDKRHFVE